MATLRLVSRSSRALLSISRPSTRPFSAYATRLAEEKAPSNKDFFDALNARGNDTRDEYRRHQTEKPLNPHLTNTTSTIANEMPKDMPPPELLSKKDGSFTPKDSVPENTERMTGGTQGSKDQDVTASNSELGVGEMEGASFKVEPLRRTGEDVATIRARLLYQSRKRGTLESELLMSTFADAHLSTMSAPLLQQYDRFLDENDWDIYYWATQSPDDSPTSSEYAEGAGPDLATPTAQGKDPSSSQSTKNLQDEWKREPAKGEWAQTVGTFKPAYRPVPKRWAESEILGLLRRHVRDKSAGEVLVGSEGSKNGGGLGMMPEVRSFD